MRSKRPTITAGCFPATRPLSRRSVSGWPHAGRCGALSAPCREAIDLIGQYQDAGVQLLINSDYRNDVETHELISSEVMPHFA